MARRFFYVSLGILALVLAYSLGGDVCRAQAGGSFVDLVNDGSSGREVYALTAAGDLWRKDGPPGSPTLVFLQTFPTATSPYVSLANDGTANEFYALTAGGDVWRKDRPDGEPNFQFLWTFPAASEQFIALEGNGMNRELYAVTASGQLWFKTGTDGAPIFHMLGTLGHGPVPVDGSSFGAIKGTYK